MDYKTPGVYVEEASLLPPSVAQVATAIPAFIGYTEKGPDQPTRITSMPEYEQLFGGAAHQSFRVRLNDNGSYAPQSVSRPEPSSFLMYHALQLFFANGGGPCYIVSAGNYSGDPSLDGVADATELRAALGRVRKVDEVTLLVMPDATSLQPNEQYGVCKDMLKQCGELKDRFSIFDLRMEDDTETNFRNGIGTSYLSYGAAYYPHLETSFSYRYADSDVTFEHGATDAFHGLRLDRLKTLAAVLDYEKQLASAQEGIDEAQSEAASANKAELIRLLGIAVNGMDAAIEITEGALQQVASDSFEVTELDAAKTKRSTAQGHYQALKANESAHTKPEIKTDLTQLKNRADDLATGMQDIIGQVNSETGISDTRNSAVADYFTNELTTQVETMLGEQRMTLPPSAALAGVYAKVDADRGVWKSPANVSLNRVSAPSEKLSLDENDNLNVHSSGKSINAIRSFTGKGVLVWGARTLDGNSNEWRYVSVRRFFNMVEESVKKASEAFVFEPNDANTWVKVKAMIENFLTIQWRAGALMGAKPEQAFFVKVGLGETMTQQDVLEGRMIVEIGMAAVRPAEFIILRFSHKMLES